MNEYAIVMNGVVENIVMWNGDKSTWSPPDGSLAVMVPEGTVVGIGYSYNSGSFTPPR